MRCYDIERLGIGKIQSWLELSWISLDLLSKFQKKNIDVRCMCGSETLLKWRHFFGYRDACNGRVINYVRMLLYAAEAA